MFNQRYPFRNAHTFFIGCIYLVILYFLPANISAQEKELPTFYSAIVINVRSNLPMSNVHILNLTQVKGTISNANGEFRIDAKARDTLYFSFLGFKPLKVVVSNDMLQFKNSKIGMTELAYALEEVVIKPYKLTGDLRIDALNAPITVGRQFSISGLPQGYEVGNETPNAVSRILSGIFNPIDGINNIFSKKAKELRKIRKIRKNDEIKDLLASKYDRQTLLEFFNIERYELNSILLRCNYSQNFVANANDLQVFEALNTCYDEYMLLK